MKNFDIIILDLNMPIMNGYKACERIVKSWEAGVCLLSVWKNFSRAVQVGPSDGVRKPAETEANAGNHLHWAEANDLWGRHQQRRLRRQKGVPTFGGQLPEQSLEGSCLMLQRYHVVFLFLSSKIGLCFNEVAFGFLLKGRVSKIIHCKSV